MHDPLFGCTVQCLFNACELPNACLMAACLTTALKMSYEWKTNTRCLFDNCVMTDATYISILKIGVNEYVIKQAESNKDKAL